jgi:predicted acyltransferase
VELLLVTLGVLGILLYLFEQAGPALARWGKPLLVFGQTALFFYVTHMFIYKVLQIMWVGDSGLVRVNLPTMYVGWAAGLLLLFPICLIYGQFKRMTPPGSPWRLF